jgi:hypothetical protein
MPKFKIRLKIQAFELEVDGEREDIPAINNALQQQFTALIQRYITSWSKHSYHQAINPSHLAERSTSSIAPKRNSNFRMGGNRGTAPIRATVRRLY